VSVTPHPAAAILENCIGQQLGAYDCFKLFGTFNPKEMLYNSALYFNAASVKDPDSGFWCSW